MDYLSQEQNKKVQEVDNRLTDLQSHNTPQRISQLEAHSTDLEKKMNEMEEQFLKS